MDAAIGRIAGRGIGQKTLDLGSLQILSAAGKGGHVGKIFPQSVTEFLAYVFELNRILKVDSNTQCGDQLRVRGGRQITEA